jgi:hypothetical protein
MKLRYGFLGALILALMGFPACNKTRQVGIAENAGPVVSPGRNRAAGVEWDMPAGWKREADRPMRIATYSIPAVPGDAEGAECGAFYFGVGQGGSVQANADRWAGEFEQPNGKAARDAAQVEKESIAGLEVTTVRCQGTYLYSSTPMEPATQKKPNYALLGAIVEAPQGLIFFKMTGPQKTVKAAEPAFTAMLASFHRP